MKRVGVSHCTSVTLTVYHRSYLIVSTICKATPDIYPWNYALFEVVKPVWMWGVMCFMNCLTCKSWHYDEHR